MKPMDILVLVFAIIFAGSMFYYTYIMYKRKSLNPEKVLALKDEVYKAMLEGGLKEVYQKVDDVTLMDAYLTLKKMPVKKAQVLKQIEIACKMEIIVSVFDERGITPKE